MGKRFFVSHQFHRCESAWANDKAVCPPYLTPENIGISRRHSKMRPISAKSRIFARSTNSSVFGRSNKY